MLQVQEVKHAHMVLGSVKNCWEIHCNTCMSGSITNDQFCMLCKSFSLFALNCSKIDYYRTVVYFYFVWFQWIVVILYHVSFYSFVQNQLRSRASRICILCNFWIFRILVMSSLLVRHLMHSHHLCQTLTTTRYCDLTDTSFMLYTQNNCDIYTYILSWKCTIDLAFCFKFCVLLWIICQLV